MSKTIVEYQEIKTSRGILRGFYTHPERNQKNIVVMFHGYTGHKNENGFMFKSLSLKLSEIGLASLRFDFMGSGDSDGDFKDMTFDTEINDAKEIIKRALELNNNKPIILMGFSFGGAISAYLSYEYMDHIEKLVLLSPAANMKLIAESTFNNPLNDGNVDMGGYLLNINFLHSFDNVDFYRNVDKFTKPVLIVHGTSDLAVPVEYGRKYHELFPHNMMTEVKDAPHCYSKVEFRKELEESVINFLK